MWKFPVPEAKWAATEPTKDALVFENRRLTQMLVKIYQAWANGEVPPPPKEFSADLSAISSLSAVEFTTGEILTGKNWFSLQHHLACICQILGVPPPLLPSQELQIPSQFLGFQHPPVRSQEVEIPKQTVSPPIQSQILGFPPPPLPSREVEIPKEGVFPPFPRQSLGFPPPLLPSQEVEIRKKGVSPPLLSEILGFWPPLIPAQEVEIPKREVSTPIPSQILGFPPPLLPSQELEIPRKEVSPLISATSYAECATKKNILPDKESLFKLKKNREERFTDYVSRWVVQAVKVKPPIKEDELVDIFISIQDDNYYHYLLPMMGRSLTEVTKMGMLVEEGLKTGRLLSITTMKYKMNSGSKTIKDKSNTPVSNMKRKRKNKNTYSASKAPVSPCYYVPRHNRHLAHSPNKLPLFSNFFPESSRQIKQVEDNFAPTGESYSSLFQRLKALGILGTVEGKIPLSLIFDGSQKCSYHSDIIGHNIERCVEFKVEIQKLLNAGLIPKQDPGALNIGPDKVPVLGEGKTPMVVDDDKKCEKALEITLPVETRIVKKVDEPAVPVPEVHGTQNFLSCEELNNGTEVNVIKELDKERLVENADNKVPVSSDTPKGGSNSS